eukprot:752990-Hanusia_phi.AAC.3
MSVVLEVFLVLGGSPDVTDSSSDEGRRGVDSFVAPSEQIYERIVFRSQVKQISAKVARSDAVAGYQRHSCVKSQLAW